MKFRIISFSFSKVCIKFKKMERVRHIIFNHLCYNYFHFDSLFYLQVPNGDQKCRNTPFFLLGLSQRLVGR